MNNNDKVKYLFKNKYNQFDIVDNYGVDNGYTDINKMHKRINKEFSLEFDNPYDDKYAQDAVDYYLFLERRTPEEINNLYKDLLKEKQIESKKEEEKNLAKSIEFKQELTKRYSLQDKSILYISELDMWHFHILTPISFNNSPHIFNVKSITKEMEELDLISDEDYFIKQSVYLNLITEYNNIEHLIRTAIDNNIVLSNHNTNDNSFEKTNVRPIDFIKWAETKESINLPQKLVDKVKSRSQLVDYQTKYQELERELEKTQNENLILKKQNIEKENKRVINTLYKMLCGIIKKHYHSEKDRVSQLKTSILLNSGNEINEKTLRTHINKALEEDQSKS